MTKIEVKDREVPFRNNNKFILIGQSAAGKDWAVKKLQEEYGYPKLVSHTTRPPRPHEKNGYDYFFVENFDPEVDRWVEYRQYETVENGKPSTWYYWLVPEQVSQPNYIGILDYEGALQLIDWSYLNLGDRPTLVYVWASPQTLRQRASKRPGYEEAEFNRRLETDLAWEEDAMEIADIIIYNDKEENYETSTND